MKLNPAKGRRRSGGRRRRSGGLRSSFSASGVMGSVKQAFSRDIVMTGVGLFGTGVAYKLIMSKYGPKPTGQVDSAGNKTYTSTLPMAASQIGSILYGIGIPVAVGMLTRRFSPAISNGAYLFGVSSLINQYIGPTVNTEIAKLAGTSAYVRGRIPSIPGVGRLGNGGRPAVAGAGNFPGYPNIFPTNSFARR